MKVVVTGGTGKIGQALKAQKPNWIYLSRDNKDLTNREETISFLFSKTPDIVIHLATSRSNNAVECFRENVRMNENLLEACKLCKVKKLVVLAPKILREDSAGLAKQILKFQIHNYNKQFGTNFFVINVPLIMEVSPEISLISDILENTANRDEVEMEGSLYEKLEVVDLSCVLTNIISHVDSLNVEKGERDINGKQIPRYELTNQLAKEKGYNGFIRYTSTLK